MDSLREIKRAMEDGTLDDGDLESLPSWPQEASITDGTREPEIWSWDFRDSRGRLRMHGRALIGESDSLEIVPATLRGDRVTID
jgi:hypothetical protein